MEWKRVSINAAAYAKLAKELPLEPVALDPDVERVDPGIRALFRAPKIEKLFFHGAENPRGLMGSTLIYPSDEYDYPAFAYDWGVMVDPHLYIFTLVDLHPLRKDAAYRTRYLAPLKSVYDKYSHLLPYQKTRQVAWSKPFHSGYYYRGRIPPEQLSDSINLILDYLDVWLQCWQEATPQNDPALKAKALAQKTEMRETYKRQYRVMPIFQTFVKKYGSVRIADKIVNTIFG